MSEDLRAAADALSIRIARFRTGLLAELDSLYAESVELVTKAEAAIPTAPDGTLVPARMLEAAREIVGKMLATGSRPSRTAVANQLRYEGFRVSQQLELLIWRYVAPMAERGLVGDPDSEPVPVDEWDAPPSESGLGSGQVTFTDAFGPDGYTPKLESVAVLNGTHPDVRRNRED